ncbi:MAG TPA: hypothetical protein VMA37_18145 [Acetobacteraceae bacterium]|nr:hypothetical protein [Acetobacteraceae bacterium]
MLLRRLGFVLVAGLVAGVGAIFLLAAAYLGLTRLLPASAAAATLGGALVLVALLVLLMASGRRHREQNLGSEQLVTAALRLVAGTVRADPEKALIAALIAGVLSEWLGKRTEPRAGQDRER